MSFRDFNDEGPGTFEWDYVLGGNTTGLFPEETHYEVDGKTLLEVIFRHTGGNKFEPVYGDKWEIDNISGTQSAGGVRTFTFDQGAGHFRATENEKLSAKYDLLIVDLIELRYIDAGAKNKCVDTRDKESTAWDFIETEESYQFACCGDDHLGNIYEAAWEMYYNRENGRPYDGIRSYEEAIGKTIVGVMADKPEAGEVFYNQGGPEGKRKGNCYKNNLYFILDDGVLVTTIDADLWVDRNAPYVETVDVSDRFRRILGSNINDISFKCGPAIKESKRYTRLVADLIMNNRKTIRFSINFDESDHTDRVTYYSIV